MCNGQSVIVKDDSQVMHKASVYPISKGSAMLKYGQIIGFAAVDIEEGCDVQVGAQLKSGTSALEGVYLSAEPVTKKGLVMMDSPGFDPVSLNGQIASGAKVVCFTTGRGSAFGSKPAPCIKLPSNSALYKKMSEDIDINYGAILDEELSVKR